MPGYYASVHRIHFYWLMLDGPQAFSNFNKQNTRAQFIENNKVNNGTYMSAEPDYMKGQQEQILHFV